MNMPPQHIFDFHGRYYGGFESSPAYFSTDPWYCFLVERFPGLVRHVSIIDLPRIDFVVLTALFSCRCPLRDSPTL